MTTDTPATQSPRSGHLRLPKNFGPFMFLVVSTLAILTVFWGAFGADTNIHVVLFDAGTEESVLTVLRQDNVLAFADENLYVVGLADGRLRAVDGRVQFSGCSVVLHPDDPRGRTRNPNGRPGVLEDPCSGAVWSVAGDAIARVNEPLRTPQLSFEGRRGRCSPPLHRGNYRRW